MAQIHEATDLSLEKSELAVLRDRYKDLTQLEFDAFLAACNRYRLNPMANQIYPQVRNKSEASKRSVSYCAQIDGYRLIADRTDCYAGNDDPVFDDESEPNKATVTVYKMVAGVRCPYTASARWNQYLPQFEQQQFMWRKMPHLMLGKCAEALALRKAFPAELSGLYTTEEMEQDRDDHKPLQPSTASQSYEKVKQEKVSSLDAVSARNDLGAVKPIDDRTEAPRNAGKPLSRLDQYLSKMDLWAKDCDPQVYETANRAMEAELGTGVLTDADAMEIEMKICKHMAMNPKMPGLTTGDKLPVPKTRKKLAQSTT